ncbi:hypothetical protein, partial [Clostridium sp.]|uniref:hypothetical protein n=1 Tax=Clostridium sp. TaxID=1506 RepID=UPI003464B155
LIKSKVKDIEKFHNENRILLQDNEGKEKELFNLKKEKSILNETKNELERDIRNLEIKFKDYEENNSYKDQVEELNNKLILLEKEAENHKKLNKYLKEKSKDVSFNTTSNFYKLKSYENKYIDLIEDLIESQIKYICLNEKIKYIPPMDIHGYIENSDDFDIEEEVNFIIRNGQKYPDSLKDKVISKVFTA